MNSLGKTARSSASPAPAGNVPPSPIQSHDADIIRLTELVNSQQLTIHSQDIKIQALVQEVAYLRRMRYGAKSEAMSAEQRQLFEDDIVQDMAAVEAELKLPPTPVTPRSRAGRQALPEHLLRVEVRHEPESCTCAACQANLIKIGEDVSEQLDIEPARFFVIRHIRPQYACRQCETVTAAPVAPAVIDGSLAAPGLLAWVATSKYLDHLPLYRLEQIAARQQVSLSRSTMSEWIGRMGFALQPLADRLMEMLKERQVLHADETPVKQLDPGAGKTKRAYLWSYRSNDLDTGPPIVVFDYQSSRSGQHARDFLHAWQGHLMVDDYAGYKKLFASDGQAVTELGCWAHARRKFFDLQANGVHQQAAEALRRIAILYAVEEAARAMEHANRALHRQQNSLPILAEMHDWLIRLRTSTADGSGLARAIDYTLNRWASLVRYAQTGNLPIDNNPVENAIRPIAIGKKNWLFAGSERAGKRAAAIQSLFATAKLNGIEPSAWLKDTLEKLPVWSMRRIDELLPIKPTAQITSV
ncbi:MAG: IS66 family transposase [Gammaproteobacteria bacterium]|nr:IS66 family transposase [Gammaproteobacteria bacterium]